MSVEPLTIDPSRQYGQTCVNGTRIPAEVLAEMVWAGDGVDELADAYEITRADVLLCCWWWVKYGHAFARRGKRRKLWHEWADHALRVFGGWEGDDAELCDPDDFTPNPDRGEFDKAAKK